MDISLTGTKKFHQNKPVKWILPVNRLTWPEITKPTPKGSINNEIQHLANKGPFWNQILRIQDKIYLASMSGF